MVLTTAIPLQLVDDPVAEYARRTAELGEGRAQIPFDFSIKELPLLTRVEYLEDVLPESPLLSDDLDLDSWEWGQGSLAACGHFAAVCAYASVDRSLPIALENGIYPKERNAYGLYFVRVALPDQSATKWMAMDSRYTVSEAGKLAFCQPFKPNSPFAPQLLLKAMAMTKGGGWDEITNSRVFTPNFPGWFRHKVESTANFETLVDRFKRGCLVTFTYAQQYDAAGNKTTPAGVVYGHAFSICDFISETDPDGTWHKVVRVQNPWNSGREPDWSNYSESSPFWATHPHLQPMLEKAKISGGNYWVGWDELVPKLSAGVVTTKTWTGVI